MDDVGGELHRTLRRSRSTAGFFVNRLTHRTTEQLTVRPRVGDDHPGDSTLTVYSDHQPDHHQSSRRRSHPFVPATLQRNQLRNNSKDSWTTFHDAPSTIARVHSRIHTDSEQPATHDHRRSHRASENHPEPQQLDAPYTGPHAVDNNGKPKEISVDQLEPAFLECTSGQQVAAPQTPLAPRTSSTNPSTSSSPDVVTLPVTTRFGRTVNSPVRLGAV